MYVCTCVYTCTLKIHTLFERRKLVTHTRSRVVILRPSLFNVDNQKWTCVSHGASVRRPTRATRDKCLDVTFRLLLTDIFLGERIKIYDFSSTCSYELRISGCFQQLLCGSCSIAEITLHDSALKVISFYNCLIIIVFNCIAFHLQHPNPISSCKATLRVTFIIFFMVFIFPFF